MFFSEAIFILSLVSVITWLVVRTIRRIQKRKEFGNRILIVKDITANIDLFFAIIFFVPGLMIIPMMIKNGFDFNLLVLLWPIYLSMLAIAKLVKGLSKIEVFENGILTKECQWKWDIVKEYTYKETKNMVEFNFKSDRRLNKLGTITIHPKDAEKIHNVLKTVLELEKV